MSKKYMEIYYVGEKLWSTDPSSPYEIQETLDKCGCYVVNDIIAEYQKSSDLIPMKLKPGRNTMGQVLIPNSMALNVTLCEKIKRLVIYLNHKRELLGEPYELCHPTYYLFNVKIIKVTGIGDRVVDEFCLPFGIKIWVKESNVWFELAFAGDLSDLIKEPWKKYLYTDSPNYHE